MTTPADKSAESGSEPIRYSKQQKDLLLWMLLQEPRERQLIDEPPGELGSYTPTVIPWSSRKFLHEEPTNTQSSTLSRALVSLEDRGLIKLMRGQGKKPRTQFLSLTRRGRVHAEALSRGHQVGISEAASLSWSSDDHNLQAMFELSVIVFRRELARAKAVLEADTDDFSQFDIPGLPMGTARTRDEVVLYRVTTAKALKTAEEMRDAGVKKFNEILRGLADLGVFRVLDEDS